MEQLHKGNLINAIKAYSKKRLRLRNDLTDDKIKENQVDSQSNEQGKSQEIANIPMIDKKIILGIFTRNPQKLIDNEMNSKREQPSPD